MVAVAVATGVGLLLGHDWLGAIGVAAGMLALSVAVVLLPVRVIAASPGLVRSSLLVGYFAAEVLFYGLFLGSVMAWLNGDPGTIAVGFGLSLGLLGGTTNSWALWQAATGNQTRLHLPPFGLAADRTGRIPDTEHESRRTSDG